MSKITVIGDTSSGKTCFLYAMYNFIAQGYVEGFTMSAANDAQDSELQSMYELLENKSLGNDRFPSPSANREPYDFSLQYGFKEIADFTWVDYPGGYIKGQGDGAEDFVEDISSSDAWVIFLDGEKLCNAILEKDSIKQKKLLMDICGKYNKFIGKNNNYIPCSVPIIVTKSDILINSLIDNYIALGNSESDAIEKSVFDVNESVKKGLSALFADANDSIKSISIVTLGDRLSDNGYMGDLDPTNIEYPITLSMLSILKHRFDNKFSRISELKQMIEKDEKKFFSSKARRDEWQAEIDKIRPQLGEWQRMANAILLTLSESKKLWKNGNEYNLIEYYKKEFLIDF